MDYTETTLPNRAPLAELMTNLRKRHWQPATPESHLCGFGVPNGDELLGNDGQDLNVNSIELVKAAPGPGLRQAAEEAPHHLKGKRSWSASGWCTALSSDVYSLELRHRRKRGWSLECCCSWYSNDDERFRSEASTFLQVFFFFFCFSLSSLDLISLLNKMITCNISLGDGFLFITSTYL